jgi:hypothetical protein
MANEIVGFSDLDLIFLVILSELTLKCVIEFDKFLRVLEHQ